MAYTYHDAWDEFHSWLRSKRETRDAIMSVHDVLRKIQEIEEEVYDEEEEDLEDAEDWDYVDDEDF